MLERFVLDLLETETDAYLLITRDFSARIRSEKAIHFQSEGDNTADVSLKRLSEDKVTNVFLNYVS